MKKKKPIFYFEKFDTFDKWSLGVYMLITIALFCFLNFAETDSYKYPFTTAYIFLTHIALYGIIYKSLRNLSVFTAWTFIGLLQWGMYFYLKEDLSLQLLIGPVIEPFKNTNLLLLVFQLLRIINLKTQGKELIGFPIKHSLTDIFDERELNLLDIILMLMYLACLILLDEIES